MTTHHRKESPATLDALRFEARFENSIPTTTPLGMLLPPHPLRDDGLPLVLSALVCLFGSWVGSDKGATWLFITERSPLSRHS